MDNPQAKRAKGNLLVVDDDLSAWQTMEAFLTREGYEVRYAECPDGTHVLIAQRGWVLKIGFQR